MTADAASARTPRRVRSARNTPLLVLAILIAVLVAVAAIAATIGAAGIPVSRLPAALGLVDGTAGLVERDRLVLWSIRLPRIVMAMIVGGMLAAAGTILQGLFRNPLADPGLVGVSAGAGLAAVTTIVFADRILAATGARMPFEILPITAFFGALVMTTLLYRVATREGRTSIAILLLAGLAFQALAAAGTGFVVFVADDRQLRDITFWTLGSLSGATWAKIAAIAPFFAILLIGMMPIARGLDLLVLGEAEAFHMGTPVERLKRIAILLVAAATGAAVAVSGVISFVGIVVPHLLRLAIGPGHRVLLPASLCLGAILVLAADTAARMIVSPAELPIGIITAAVGAPFFLVLLLRQRSLIGL